MNYYELRVGKIYEVALDDENVNVLEFTSRLIGMATSGKPNTPALLTWGNGLRLDLDSAARVEFTEVEEEPGNPRLLAPMEQMDMAVAVARSYYRLPGCSTGGNLHILLDDDNTEADHVAWCAREALKNEDAAGLAIALYMYGMIEPFRAEVCRRIYADGDPCLSPTMRWDGGIPYENRPAE